MSGIVSLPTVLDARSDGTIYARCPVPLGPYATCITDRLEHWAQHAPDRTFLARRDTGGQWHHLTYAEALTRTRAVAQALLDRKLSADRPVIILSGNSLEHAVLALAAMHVGIPYAPLAPAYSLLARDYTTLRGLWQALEPGLVFAGEGTTFERPLARLGGGAEIVTATPADTIASTSFAELLTTPATGAIEDAHATVTADTIAKILYTSGSTGRPKGVINTHRMLCANQAMIRAVMPLLEDAPVLCDWLPWNHTFGGNHNFGIVLYNGGTLYIDDGKPIPDAIDTTLRNLREVPVTAYFNVPRGYELLVPQLRQDAAFREHFFSRLRMLFCAAAALRQHVADDMLAMASAGGRRIPLVTGLGSTETAPFALCAGDSDFSGGRIGVPVPGVELKLAPAGKQYEARVRGPNVTPGYWRAPELTAAAFDDEGYYLMGDALAFFDRDEPEKGFTFQGRLSEDFKLSTGTWLRVGPLRRRFLAHFGDLATEVVIAGHDRDEVTALVFPSLAACRALCSAGNTATVREILGAAPVRAAFAERLAAFDTEYSGHSTAIARMILLEQPPSIDGQELTDKGSVNQKQVLLNRSELVDQLYGGPGTGILIGPGS